ncbi:sensor histidine kinase [Roseococcus thiosulfatophilus]|uniref:sensor histidine kinase n=1 Tax=Roseococcus thiosulfatophilus TaxID=35813 RepID=UPI001A90A65A|nr:HAMP domain-containing sensor histidine kinase [Roseococcus thiosulfatophilus]
MNALFYVSLAGALLVAWRLTRPMPGPMEWATAAILFAFAFGQLSAGLDQLAPIPRVINSTLWLTGGILLLNGLRRFFGRPTQWKASALLLVVAGAGAAWAVLVAQDNSLRIVVTSLGGLILLAAILFNLAVHRDRASGMGLGFAALGFTALAGLLVIRIHHNLLLGPADFANLGFLVAVAAMPTTMAVGLLGLLLMTIERLLEQLREAQARLEEASRAKTDFLLGMGHELRTPLNAIMGFNQLLATDPDHPLTPLQHDYVREIEQGGQRLLRLIEDAQDVKRIEDRGVSLRIEALDLPALMRDAAAVALPASRKAGVTLTVTPGQGRILADRGRLQQVLGNLLSNAIKYNRKGGEVHLRAARPETGWTRLEVTDTGIGIPAGRQDEVFQRFNRLGAEHSAVEGTGIGLAIARELTEAMGGRMGFDSTEGQGSRFWIDLPAARG